MATRSSGRSVLVVAVLCIPAVLAGCGDDSREASTVARPSTTRAATETTTGPAADDDGVPTSPADYACDASEGGDEGSWFLKDVRLASHDGYDRVTFEFAPTVAGAEGVPRYAVALRDPPYLEDPSDLPVDVHGGAAIGVTFLNASGVDLTGTTPVQVYTGPEDIPLDGASINAAVAAGDFENTMSWLLGMDAPHCFRVTTLDDPPRVVVDVSEQDAP